MSESATKVELVDYDPELALFAQAERQSKEEELERFIAETTETEKQAVFLRELLRRKWLCVVAAESKVLHRGQAIKGELKDQGHKIEIEIRDGRKGYVHHGYEKKIWVGNLKEAYYTTEHWIRIAKQRKEMDGFCCRQCGATHGLQTHHHRYELFAEDVKLDLITYCESCHQRVHEGASGGRLHFPRYVSEAIAQRIIAEQVDFDDEEWREEFYAD
jgi:hypothetical protein